MNMVPRPSIKCSCSYVCRYTEAHFAWVSLDTYSRHQHLSALGIVHRNVRPCHQAPNPIPRCARRSSQHVLCACRNCKGEKYVTRKTAANHMKLEATRRRLNNLPPYLGEVSENEELHHAAPAEAHESVSCEERSDGDDFEVDVDEHNADCDFQSDINLPAENVAMESAMAPRSSSIDDALIATIIDLQRLLDKSHVSVEAQGQAFKLLFGSGQANSATGEESTVDLRKLSLGHLLALKGPDWNGELNGCRVPTSWKNLMNMYNGLGMLKAQKWRLCTGKDSDVHAPHIMKPHVEDDLDVHLNCTCNPRSRARHRRDCQGCGQKCEKCHNLRRDCLRFEYISLESLLSSFCECRSFCYNFLTLWRKKDEWKELPMTTGFQNIKEFWHGTKFGQYQNFWDPMEKWEGPQCCKVPTCNRYYRAFPSSMKCAELSNVRNWNEERTVYSFPCSECGALVEGPKIFHKVLYFNTVHFMN